MSAERLEVNLTAGFTHIKQEVLGKGTILDILQNLLHSLLRLVRHNLRANHIPAVLSRIGDRIPHTAESGLIDQIDDELHLMDALKICISRVIPCFHKGLESCLHQSSNAAAQDSLLTEQIGFRLGLEGRLKKTSSCSADCKAIGKRQVLCLSGIILLDSDQAWGSSSSLIFRPDRVPRSLRRDHGHIDVCRRNDTAIVNIEPVCKHQHVAFLQVRCDVLLVHGCLFLIIDQDHNDICTLCCLRSRVDLKSLLLCLLPGLGTLIEPDDDLASGVSQVQCMCMSLASITDNCNCLPVKQGQIAVFLIENLRSFCHDNRSSFPL